MINWLSILKSPVVSVAGLEPLGYVLSLNRPFQYQRVDGSGCREMGVRGRLEVQRVPAVRLVTKPLYSLPVESSPEEGIDEVLQWHYLHL